MAAEYVLEDSSSASVFSLLTGFLRAVPAIAVFGCVQAIASTEPHSAVDQPTVILDVGRVTADVLAAPVVEHVGLVAPDTLLLLVRAQSVEHGRQVRYEAEEGDDVLERRQHRILMRDGKAIGTLVGLREDVLKTVDRLVGEPLDIEWASDPASYNITSDQDSAALSPEAVYRVSRPFDNVRLPGESAYAAEHHIYLRFPHRFSEDATYTVTFSEGNFSMPSVAFSGNWRIQRSEAVHVSQIGFRPDDPIKLAYLSTWMGDGGGVDYGENLRFSIIADESNDVVYQGKVKLSQAASAPGNVSGTNVYKMDFSLLNLPGVYRVAVEGIGCSFPFTVQDDVWRNAFGTAMRGLYCQRSGVALGPPVTPFVRLRGFMPTDGVKVFASETKPGSQGHQGNRFQRLLDGRQDRILPDAWGGWMDAGDWDRRPDHALMSLAMFDLLEMFPEVLGGVDYLNNDLDDPNALPDLAQEALWGVDFWHRMQEEDGSVNSGIESGAHPRMGEASWQESLLVMGFAPTVKTTLDFAAIAARASWWLGQKDAKRSEVYHSAALRAMAWVEEQPQEAQDKVSDHLALAGAELYRLSGEERWHQLFLSNTRFQSTDAPFCASPLGAVKDAQSAAAWVYLQTAEREVNEQVSERIRDALVREADESVQHVRATDFNFAGGPKRTIIWGALSVPEANTLVRAHFVTGREEYLDATILSAQSGAGANPLNLCYTTGVGQRWPQNPLHEDARHTRQPLYSGVTIGGPIQTGLNRQPSAPVVEAQLYPKADLWPASESYFDVFTYPAMCEFTVHQTMLPTAFVWGYLAARR